MEKARYGGAPCGLSAEEAKTDGFLGLAGRSAYLVNSRPIRVFFFFFFLKMAEMAVWFRELDALV